MFSFQEAKLCMNQPFGSMETRGLLLKNVVDLWRIIEEIRPLYRLFTLNCRWYSSVIWENLTHFSPGERPAISDGSLLNRVVKAVGRDTAQKTKVVTRLFLATLETKSELALPRRTYYSIPRSVSKCTSAPKLLTSLQLFYRSTGRVPSTESFHGECKPWRFYLKVVLDSEGGRTRYALSAWKALNSFHLLDTTQMIIFLVTYKAFASGTEVLDELKAYSKRDDPSYLRYGYFCILKLIIIPEPCCIGLGPWCNTGQKMNLRIGT